MKNTTYLIILLFSVLFQYLKGQDTKPVYFEPVPNNMMRFYFDQHYYLVDKDCEFKYIERVSAFDKKNNNFEGIFKDFDPYGRLILSGNYQNGKKQGEFKAYHSNGALKWEANFINDEATGSWKYYYPDGKPMLFITLSQSDFYINQYWDRKGQHLVIDGEGTYDIDLPIMGFTEHGYTTFNREGKVKNGRPDGLWNVSFIADGKKKQKVHLMTEQYENGEFKGKQVVKTFGNMLIPERDFVFSPNDYFPRAELLLGKNCSFDEYTGFNIFIAAKFMNFLERSNYQSREDFEQEMTYTVRVSKKGAPAKAILKPLPDSFSKNVQNLLNTMVQQIGYYLPSYLSGNPIDDVLTISFKIQAKGESISILPVQIHRQKGI